LDEVLTRRRVRPNSLGNRNAEAQFQNLFRNLGKLQITVPQLADRSELFREAAYRICLTRGKEDLRLLDTAGARNKLKKAAGYFPFRFRPWIFFIASLLPTGFLRLAKRVLQATTVPAATVRHLH
jgi:hypothetical protein